MSVVLAVEAVAVVGLLAWLRGYLERAPDRRWLCWALGLGLAARLVWAWAAPGVPRADFLFYHQSAASLARGEGYTTQGQPTAFWPPGWPLALSLLYRPAGPDLRAGKLFGIALALLSVGLTWALARRLFGVATAAFASLLLAVWPGQVFFAAVLASEPLTQVLVLLGLWIGLRARGEPGALLAGVVLGGGALTRPVALLVGLALGVPWRAREGLPAALRRTGLLLFGASLVVLPWTVRNYLVLGHLVPISTNGGVNFWQGNNPRASGGHMEPEGYAELFQIPDESDREREAYRRGLAFVQAHPGRAVVLAFRKVAVLLEKDDGALWESATRWDRQPAVLGLDERVYRGAGQLGRAFFLAVLACAAVGLWAVRGQVGGQMLAWALAVVVAFHAAYKSEPRYNHILAPFLALLAAEGVRAGRERLGERSGVTTRRCSGDGA